MRSQTAFLLVALVVLLGSLTASARYTIELKRSVNANQRNTVLMSLKQMQDHNAALLETGDEPLSVEILSTKHLATYYGEIKIDGQPFRTLFDTGSCEFWVPSTMCDTARCMKHRRFDLAKTKGGVNTPTLDHQMKIQYLSGQVSGDMVRMPVQLGDVKVPRQVIGLASIVSISLLDDVVWDGIIGLAFPNPSLASQGVIPVMDTIINDGILKKKGLSNQFAYYIDDKKGAVTFGGANCDLIKEGTQDCINDFKFVKVTELTYWTVKIKSVRLVSKGNKPGQNMCPSGGCKAIVDTGTYLTYGPASQVNAMKLSLNGCASHTSMPAIEFEFEVADGDDPVTVRLNPIDYVLKFDMGGTEECVMGISPDQDTIWTLGQVFLRSFYTVFDRDENKIGFARLARNKFNALNAADKDVVNHRNNNPGNFNSRHQNQKKKGKKGKKAPALLEIRPTTSPSSPDSAWMDSYRENWSEF